MPKAEEQGNWFKRHKILTAVIALIIIGLSIGASGDKKNVTPTTTTTEASIPSSQVTPDTKKQLTESDAENYCEDAGLLGKYIDTSKTAILTATTYKPYYSDSGELDKSGNTIWVLKWTGKNKDTEAAVPFVCQISGTSAKDIELHSLSVNGQVVYGPINN